MSSPKLRDVLSPINGLFSNMPQTIWGTDLDPELIDVELWTRIGGLEISPLAEYYVSGDVLDTETLGRLLFQRYGKNWARIWDALLIEYNIVVTSSTDETRMLTREHNDTETRDLFTTEGGDIVTDATENATSVRTGSISRSGDNVTTHDVTDLETRNLTGNTTEGGTESVTDTFDEATGTDTSTTFVGSEKVVRSEDESVAKDSTLTFAGSENVTRGEEETSGNTSTVTFAGSETTTTGVDEVRNLSTTNTGTVGEVGSETNTGTGSTTTDEGKYGIGSAALANDSKSVAAETRNFTNGKTGTRTDNLSQLEGGTQTTDTTEAKTFSGRNDSTVESGNRDLSGTENKTFVGRNDTTDETEARDLSAEETKSFLGRSDNVEGTETHTGTVAHETDFGRTTSTSEGGTLSQKRTGTEGVEESSTETYNALTDANNGTNNATETRDLRGTQEGSVAQEGSETTSETFHSEGSSPLRTYQALIQEELDGRKGQAWNFTDIVIRDVQQMVTSRIWRR